jgi:hypothetical protein
MFRFVLAAAAALLVSPASADPHWGWPTHDWPPFTAWERPARFGGDGRRLPDALIHGPHGPQSFPFVDRRANRPSGGLTRRFPRPTWGHARLDWCAAPGAGCGPEVAQHFCIAQGYRRVVEAVQERDVGAYAPTAQIASGLACAGPGCHGFMQITCTRG